MPVSLVGSYTGFSALPVQTGGTFFPSDIAQSAAASTNSFLNNGVYGDPALVSSGGPVFASHGGVFFSSPVSVSLVAFGRDNSGFFSDAAGTYLIQATSNPMNSLDGNTNWETVGVVNNFANTSLPSPALRHVFQFENQLSGSNLLTGVFGIRVLVPFRGQSQLDELEVYSTPLPASSTSYTGTVAGVQLASGQYTPGGNVSLVPPSPIGVPSGVYLSAPGVLFSPNPAQIAFNATSGSFLTQCSTIGPVTVSFGTLQTPALYGTSTTFCYGSLLAVQPVPLTVLRGNSFVVTLQLVPPPTSATEFVVRVSSRYVEPGTERVYFAAGQSTAQVNFNTDPNGPVGDVQIEFRSRQLRLYLPLTISVRIVGQITSSLSSSLAAGAILPYRVTTPETVTLVPPITQQLLIDNADNIKNNASIQVNVTAPFALVAPSNSLTFVSGQASSSITVFPTQLGQFLVNITSPYHLPLVIPVTVQGSLFASLPTAIRIGTLSQFELSVEPAPSSPLVVSISATNGLTVPPNATFTTTSPSVPLSLSASTSAVPGTATVTFSAPGYVTLVFPITVSKSPVCAAGSVLAANAATCAVCPANFLSGQVCSGGQCVASTVSQLQARCVCSPASLGRACEYVYGGQFGYSSFTTAGTSLTSTPTLGNSAATVLSVPANLLAAGNDPINGGSGQVILESVSASNTFVSSLPWVDVTTQPVPTSPLATYTIAPTSFAAGFVFDVLNLDNTPVTPLASPIGVHYYPDQSASEDLRYLVLYYWTGSSFVPAETTCATPAAPVYSQAAGSVYYQLCKQGQYVWYIRQPVFPEVPVVPSVAHPLPPPSFPRNNPDVGNVVAGTTGATGVQPQAGVQPDFVYEDLAFDPEPLRQPLYMASHSSASTLSCAVALLVFTIVVALF